MGVFLCLALRLALMTSLKECNQPVSLPRPSPASSLQNDLNISLADCYHLVLSLILLCYQFANSIKIKSFMKN